MKILIHVVVVMWGLVTAVSGQVPSDRQMPADFKSDNCTMFPDGNYVDCCVEHDKDYYFGGSLKERRASDKRLKECVASKGRGWKRKLLANAMYIGVRVGGVHFLPTPFRWGFGNKWPRKEPEKPKTQPTDP
ncbi:MAG TPA: hypothetical protein VNA17_04510 [Pyrinomonadaceae bacterium]|nr:hypothetical protein [Pyrinomonadaceae bacterium]